MEIFPKALGTRPLLAVEIRWGGVVGARTEDGTSGVLSAVSQTELSPDALEPGLKAGNFKLRAAVVAAVRRTLEAVSEKGMGREVTLVVPDAAVRVLLLDFDTLPAKVAEALPVVRFRLKKLLPFDADDAMVSYQIMSGESGGKGPLRVVAVAIPQDVITEYEAVVRDAGFEPGAVLPSTLAALSGLPEDTAPALIVNAGPQAVTTAIVDAGVLLLHRSVDMSGNVQVGILAEAAVTVPETSALPILPLVDADSTLQEWAMQEPVDPFGRGTIGGLAAAIEAEVMTEIAAVAAAEFLHAADLDSGSAYSHSREITQAVSVAAAYFEDTLERSPDVVLSAGSVDAGTLAEMLEDAGFGEIAEGSSRTRVRELVDAQFLEAQAATARVPRSWLSGVRGALKS